MKLTIDHHHYIHLDQALGRELGLLHQQLNAVLAKEDLIMSALDDLTAQVAANKTVMASALVLINGIAARITAAGTDPVALAALTASLKSDDDALAAAVTANTPAATT